MTNQLDLFALGAPPAPSPPPAAPQPPVASPALHPWPNAHLRPPPEIRALAGASPKSLAALAAIELLEERPPVIPGAFPRIAVARDGWNQAMEHRHHLALLHLAGVLTPGDAEALAALNHVYLQQVDGWNEGPVIITAAGYDHLQNALAGLRCAAQEQAMVDVE